MDDNTKSTYTETSAFQAAAIVFSVYFVSNIIYRLSVAAIEISTRDISLTLKNALIIIDLPITLWHSLTCALIFFALFYNFLKGRNTAVGAIKTGKLVLVFFLTMIIFGFIFRIINSLQQGNQIVQSYQDAMVISIKRTSFQFIFDVLISYTFFEIYKYFAGQSLVKAPGNSPYLVRRTSAVLISLIVFTFFPFMSKLSHYFDQALGVQPEPVSWLVALAIGIFLSLVTFLTARYLIGKSRTHVHPWRTIVLTFFITSCSFLAWVIIHQITGSNAQFPIRISLNELLSIIIIPLGIGSICALALNVTSKPHPKQG